VTLLLVLAGGAVGAPLRYLVDEWVTARTGGSFPWGTFAVNMGGSFVLGVLAAAAPDRWLDLAGIGLCGALTTFSTFSFETVRLLEERRLRPAVLNVAGSLTLGLALAAAGWWLGSR
jgi:fluoride exporter